GESLPLHLASMLGLVELVVERNRADPLAPGDMVISNDPFVGRGSHLPDVAFVAPVFRAGRIACFVTNIAHHADIGGMVPGSMAGGMTEVYQEGLRIPPVRFIRAGAIVDDLFDIILLNVRVPEERRGDYLAQIAANRLGERRLQELFARWPDELFQRGTDAIIDAVARRTRAGIRALPDGEYRFEDVMDDDGLGTENIPIRLRIEVRGEEILFDFTGSAPQTRGNINVSRSALEASVLFGLKVLIDPDGPTNHGMLQPVRIEAPLGTLVNAAFPAATAARSQVSQRIIDVILGALAPALPERVIAAGNGANTLATFSGTGPGGRFYVYMEAMGGGAGARAYKDGADGVQVHTTNTSNLPIESLEREYPLLIERYELVPDSGGAGTWRGGLALRRVYRPLGHTAIYSGQGERIVNRPWGLFGGETGETGQFELVHDDGRCERLPIKPMSVAIPPDATLSITTPGAGGYGPPAGRSRESLRRDFASGKYGRAFLRKAYGYTPE
ncbi:MAG: hydantoinase B/oxoprolinase family protein, partial [Alphaproteobacteria bacterium]|nr:hydantoinase B/oxoprolinase family protein [Alphaproteobacteria bacterium]